VAGRSDRERPAERLQRIAVFTLFGVSLLYGLAIVAALSNTALLLTRLAQGEPPGSSLPLALLGWGVILLVNKRRGWPPFSRRG
jgi:hypothetical protein